MKARKLITYACVAFAVLGTSLVFTNARKRAAVPPKKRLFLCH